MQTLGGMRCKKPAQGGVLLVLGWLLASGCAPEDTSTPTLPDATTTVPQPGVVLDAAQGAIGNDGGVPSGNDAAAAAREDAFVPVRDAASGSDTGTHTYDASAAPADAQTLPTDAQVCARWNAERADLSEGMWTGSVETCMPGETPPAAATNALRVFNLYRTLAGLAPLMADAEANRRAQGCALLMAANGTITHQPPSTWKCYSAEAAATAGSSSLATGPAVSSVDGYMLDPGNDTTLGHRRWVLSAYLASVGFGTAGRFSCQYQPPRQGGAGAAKPWTAWPAPGQMPLQVFKGRFAALDQTGWSIQSDSVNLQAGQVSVTRGGSPLAVTTSPLPGGYGSRYALRFVPQGWTTAAGSTYEVSITGIATPITYSVEVVDCKAP
jgi:uncharacterized protein YkwD